jgi:hypothetical protein
MTVRQFKSHSSGHAMNNLVLALVVVVASALWARADFWLPAAVPLSVAARRRSLFLIGLVVMLAATAFAFGDAIGGRAQISRSPVRYATRLSGLAAHHHDLADPFAFWRQVVLEASVGGGVGAVLILLSRRRNPRTVPARQ